jgi:hypothetical protein
VQLFRKGCVLGLPNLFCQLGHGRLGVSPRRRQRRVGKAFSRVGLGRRGLRGGLGGSASGVELLGLVGCRGAQRLGPRVGRSELGPLLLEGAVPRLERGRQASPLAGPRFRRGGQRVHFLRQAGGLSGAGRRRAFGRFGVRGGARQRRLRGGECGAELAGFGRVREPARRGVVVELR